MKATLTNYKQSPRKVRLVADMIRGKRVVAAREALAFLPKKSAPEMVKLLNSAIANARTQGVNPDDLVVKTVFVNKAAVIRRFKPMARGRAAGIRRTMSHVTIELGAATNAEKPKKSVRKTTKTESAAKPSND